MVTVSETVTIDAPPERVFAFLDDPHNHVEVTPGLAAVRNVEAVDNGGKRFDHTFEMAGVTLEGELVQTTHEPPERMVFEMHGTLSGEVELLVEEDDGKTAFTYRGTYALRGRVLSTVSAPVVRRYNERTLRRTVENVMEAVESGEDVTH